MTEAASSAIAVTRALDRVMRQDRGRLLSALIARLRDFQLAEDALQDALFSAVAHWGAKGLPASPQGWLLKVALRKAIDRLRRAKTDSQQRANLATLAPDEAVEEPEIIPDERLRLIFTCCHPALDPKSRVALTLRTLGGLSTPQIAKAFLDTDTTMGQRLSRAKAKISAAGIAYVVPGPEDWSARLNSVLTVIYLIFNAGYGQGADETGSHDLCDEAIFLARLMVDLRPGDAEIEGLLSLLLIIQSRKGARVGADGEGIGLGEQDISLWDLGMAEEGQALLDRAMIRRAAGPFQIKAALQALQVDGRRLGMTDWPQIVLLYTSLLRWEDTPVVRMNRAVAQAEAGHLQTALATLDDLQTDLQAYQPFHAACADLFARAGRFDDSRHAYDRAISFAQSKVDVLFLVKRRAMVPE